MTAPKLFISYSWSSQSHVEWVLALATELRESGIDVILDKWDLKEGQDAHTFMERMVSDAEIKKVAIVCDRIYAEKANGRSGGVGTETQILSPEIYARQDQTKFVAILPERDEKTGEPFLPVYYKSRIFIDLSNTDLYSKNYEQLVRWVFDKPLYVKPAIGAAPAFLSEGDIVSLQTSAQFRRALDAVRESRPHCSGAIREYFEAFAKNLERFRIPPSDGPFDDEVVKSIEQFLPYRNEVIELLGAIVRYRRTQDSWDALHRFFETLFPYMDCPEGVRSYREGDVDNFRFIIHEIFLHTTATLLRAECFAGLAHLVRQYYFVDTKARRGREALTPFAELREPLPSLDNRMTRLKSHRVSLQADLLEHRAKMSGIPFHHIMQADLVLFLRDCMDVLRRPEDRGQGWWPVTLIYAAHHYGPFEIFARSQSAKYFADVQQIFDIQDKGELVPLFDAFKQGRLRVPQWTFHTVNPADFIAFDKLATLP